MKSCLLQSSRLFNIYYYQTISASWSDINKYIVIMNPILSEIASLEPLQCFQFYVGRAQFGNIIGNRGSN